MCEYCDAEAIGAEDWTGVVRVTVDLPFFGKDRQVRQHVATVEHLVALNFPEGATVRLSDVLAERNPGGRLVRRAYRHLTFLNGDAHEIDITNIEEIEGENGNDQG